MDKAITRALRCKPEAAAQFIEDAGGEMNAAHTILEWDRHTKPVPYVNKNAIKRQVYVDRLREWAERWRGAGGVQEFMSKASVFEFYVTLHVNCMYPTLAFQGVSIQACQDLARTFQIHPEPPEIVYAIICAEISRLKSATRDQLTRALARYNIAFENPVTLRPFPPDILEGHPLDGVDVEMSDQNEVLKLVPKGKAVEMLREAKFMRNRIVLVTNADGAPAYTFHQGVSRFVELIRGYLI